MLDLSHLGSTTLDKAEENSLAPREGQREKRYCKGMYSSSFQQTFREVKPETVNVVKKCGQKFVAVVALLASQTVSSRRQECISHTRENS